MLTSEDIENFLSTSDYDIRKTGRARWIDQKCTPDVVWSIADFILDYVDKFEEQFTVKKIWQSDYAKQTIKETYSKPDADEKKAEREYDKVFSQPMNLFCYAGILEDVGKGRRHLYIVKNRNLLEYIAQNDVCALRFLQLYIEKVLKDSDLYACFQKFFNKQDKQTFLELKSMFVDFCHEYTPVKKDYEPKRIFTKIINPLAYKYLKKGANRGFLSHHQIKRSDLMYNQDNFRDIYEDKPKHITRQEWLKTNPNLSMKRGYFEQMLAHSKKILKENISKYRNNLSELTMFSEERPDKNIPTQSHHIFPKNEYPELIHYIENLIALTPNQHNLYAHQRNNTRMIDKSAQKAIIIAKVYSIKHNLESDDEKHIYEFNRLLEVLRSGFDDDSALGIRENDFDAVLSFINSHYEKIV